MKWRTSVRLLVCLGLCFLAAARPGLADESAPAEGTAAGDVSASAAASARWLIDNVDTPGNVGQHLSMAIHAGTTWISYYDADNGDLRVARSGVSGGNCGPGNTWSCQALDTTGDVGRYSSIAINPVSGNPAIAYYDVTNSALKYIAYGCLTPGACLWLPSSTIDDTANSGQWASLKIDATGKPHIAYYESGVTPPPFNFPYGGLKYAQRLGSGGNCGPSSTWQCDMVDSSIIAIGQYASLDLNASNQPYIAYYAAGDLKYAWTFGTSGNCGPGGNTWRCIVIDDGGSDDVGKYASLHVAKGASDVTQIAYYDVTNRALKYATFSTTGTCTPSNWNCRAIDSIGEISPSVGRAISLVSGTDGSPLIAYYDADDGGDLKLAYPEFFTGNCAGIASGGFPPTIIFTWRCETIDAGPPLIFGLTHDVGQYAALMRNSAGLATIAYYNATAGDLRLAYQRLAVSLPMITR